MRLHKLMSSWFVAGALAVTPLMAPESAPAVAPAAAATTGCGCLETGPYQDPKPMVAPRVANANGDSATTDPKYHLEASGTGSTYALTVTRNSDSQVFHLSTSDTQWGFSPDQDRLLTHGISGGQLTWSVFDLAGASPATAHQLPQLPAANARVGFSPGGDYVVATTLTGTSNVTQYVADARTGAKAFQDSYTFTIAPTGDEFGGAGYGFSPDGDELAYAFVTGQDSVTLRLANLRTSSAPVTSMPISGGYWQFSPCGSVLGVVNQTSGSSATITGVRNDGTLLPNSISINPSQTSTIAFRATTTDHFVAVDGVDHVLGTNTARTACPDTARPTWPVGAALTASDVTKTTLRLDWSEADDDVGVTKYKIYRGSTLLGTLPATTRTYDVSGLAGGTAYTFHVEAGDAAGNWSTDGPSTVATTSVGAPTWPAGSSLTASDVTNTSMTLRWSAADDDVAVTGYRVFQDGTQIGTTTGARTLPITGLSANTAYQLRIEAVDNEGHVSTGGPTASLRTSGLVVLDTPSIVGTIWNDTNRDGHRDTVEVGVPSGGDPALGIYLYRVNGDVVQSQSATSSNQNGEFRFDNLPDGHYVLSLIVYPRIQTFPTDYQPMQLDVVNGHGEGNADMGVTIGHFPDLDSGTATINGTVFADQDGDGASGAGDTGLGGMTVDCYDVELGAGCGNGPAAVTGQDGSYTVTGVLPGTHVLNPRLEDGQYLTAPADGRSRLVVLSSGQTAGIGAFGVTTGHADVHGTVFFDHDQDGVRDPGDETLTASDLRFFDVCVRDEVRGVDQCGTLQDDGTYDVTGLPGGTFSLGTAGGALWTPTTTSVTVAASGTTAKDVGLFGHVGSIHGVVWDDRDGDGVRDTGEPGIADHRVCWRETGTAEGTFGCLRTDVDGSYDAPYVASASYDISADQVADATQTKPAEDYLVDLADGGSVTADFGFHAGVAPVAPGPPTGLTARPGDRSATLTWTAPANDGGSSITDYVVQRSDDGSTWTTSPDPVSTQTRVVVTGLGNGKATRFRVAAISGAGQGDWTAPATVTPRTKPSAPRSPHATARSRKVLLSWRAPSSTGGAAVTDYVVQRSTRRNGGWTTVRDGVSTRARATAGGLHNGTRYFFRVAARNAAGTGPWSTLVAARPHT